MEYYEMPGSSAPERSYSAAQRWLVGLMLLLGLIFTFGVFSDATLNGSLQGIGLTMGAFWAYYLICFYFITWKKTRASRTGWFLAAAAILLYIRYFVYREQFLSLLNLIIAPAILMLHAVETTTSSPGKRQGRYILLYLRGWFVAPFVSLGRFFGAIGSMFKKDGDKSKPGGLAAGLLVGIPLFAAVLALLINADAAMDAYFERLFGMLSLGNILTRVIFAVIVAALFYSFIYTLAFAPEKQAPESEYPRPFASVSAVTVMALLLLAYALFTAFQLAYLTGFAGLPEGLTYSQYAVKGFSELCAVASINFLCFALILNFSQRNKAVNLLLGALLFSTALILLFAAVRLSMYISVYGLTVKRILSAWFMALLFVLLALSAIKLINKEIPLLRLAAGAAVTLYLALNIVNLDGMIAKSVLTRAEAAGSISREDADYLRYTLSSDAKRSIASSPLKADIYYDVEPEDIP